MSDNFAQGWVDDPQAVAVVAARQPFPTFGATEAGRADLDGDHAFLWEAAKKVTGDILPPRNQGQVGCHDDKTEVLTDRGWVRWQDYSGGERLGTMNPTTHRLEFQRPTALHVYDYDGPLYYSTHRSLDFAVTPNHRMYRRKWNEGQRTLSDDFSFTEMSNAGWYYGLPHATSGYSGIELEEVTIPGSLTMSGDDFVALLAVVAADGWAGGTDNTRDRVGFCCFRDDRYPAVRDLASRLGFREQPSRKGVWCRNDGHLAEWFRQHGYTSPQLGALNKKVPDIVKECSQRQIERFLLYFGDQYDNDHRRVFYSSSKRQIDDLQELMLRIGKRGTVCRCEPRQAVCKGRPINGKEGYALVERTEDRLSVERKRNIEQERYSGRVYCATVPNSLLVTRRNDSVLVSGNSCVSFGTATAIEHLMCVEIANGDPEQYKDLAQEVIYGGSRVEVGGGRIGGDGSVGAWAAEFVKKWGVVARGVYGQYDLSRYSESTCRSFGSRGVPDELEALAKKTPVQAITKVTSFDEACKALLQGYPIAICSNQGFTMQRDAEGFCRASGSWAHCYPADTLVAGPTFRRIADLKAGDTVYGHDGAEHRVSGVMTRKFRGNLARIKAVGMPTATMTDEHPVLVYRKVKSGFRVMQTVGAVADSDLPSLERSNLPRFEPAWVSAGKVRPGDYLVTPGLIPSGPAEAPAHWLQPSSETAWLLGVCIGDGTFAPGHKIRVTLGRKKPWRRVVEALRAAGFTPKVERHPTFLRVTVYSAEASRKFREWFVAEDGTKKIPSWLLTWDTEALVEGLMAADGCEYKGGRRLTTVSRTLAEQVRMILIGLGEGPVLRKKTPGAGAYANAKTQYEVDWHPGGRRKPFDGKGLYKVSSVILTPYEGEVYNCEVDDVHSYVADGFATHNCMALIGFKKGGRPAGAIANSWGGSAHTGPTADGLTPAGFWADASTVDRMLRQGDSWAFSAFQGFPARKLNWYA
jgi:hypothetical protein